MRPFALNRISVNYAIYTLVSGIFFLICLISLSAYINNFNSPQKIYSRIEKVLLKKEIQTLQILRNNIYNNFYKKSLDGNIHTSSSFPEIRNNGIAVQYFVNDSLVFWSDNSVEELKTPELQKEKSIQKLQNGWYEIIVLKNGNRKAAGLILIKYEYSFENEYLENTFQKDFDVNSDIRISNAPDPKAKHTEAGNHLFSLDFSGYVPVCDKYTAALSLLLLLTFFSFFLSVYFFYSSGPWFRKRPWIFVSCFVATILLLRLIQACFSFPAALYSTAFFSPLYYSSSVLLPSAGDYLINSLIILFIANVAFNQLSGPKQISPNTLLSPGLKGGLSVLFIFSIYITLCLGLEDLVRNSSFSLDLKDVSKIGIQSMVGLLITYSLSLAFYLFSRTSAAYTVKCSSKLRIVFIIVATACVFVLTLIWRDITTAITLSVLFTALGFLLFFYFKEKTNPKPFANIILPIIWMSILVSAVFYNAGYSKEKEERKLIALKLATEKNPVTEILYTKLEQRLLTDSLVCLINKDTGAVTENALVKRIKSTYIKNSWNRFTVQITVCTPGKMLKIQPRGYVFDCEQYFRQVCDKVGEKTLNPNLFYLDYGTGTETYLAILSPYDSTANQKNKGVKIYIELTAKTPAKDMGYPELLIDRRIMNIPDLGNYSYALYQGGSLVYKSGKHSYAMNLSDFDTPRGNTEFFHSAGMDHYRYSTGTARVLIISKKDDTFLGIISPASYLFILFSFLTLILNLVFRPAILQEFSFMTLKSRFQLANVGIIVVSFLILGCLLLYFLIRLNNLKNMDSFNERTLSVISEMQNNYGDKESLEKTDKIALEEELQRLSGMFYTDVNMYSPSGKLILSSRPQVFDEGLISGRMNMMAFIDLKRNSQSAFFQDERIGAYDYISAYFPLLNDRNEVLAYINLPFFSRQEDLKKVINDFLVAFMNLYILFILISVFISIAISRYLAAPLRILVSRMEGFQLGKRNEKIIWNHHDEIGQLVEEYNRLIDELAFSADQLARSERESAWREMARQVAHEIKNPLTPMKLSVQHLDKVWDQKSDDFDLRLKRFTRIMTEQIDTLSEIATEFSDFAKMPLPIAEALDLVEILNFSISMYSGLDNIQIHFEAAEATARIIGDKKQVVRVFTNLLNNAVQAISTRENAWIRIKLHQQENNYIVDIEDNGDGVPDELAGKIFLPNFTTKSGGAGLGLAIVRGIIRGMGGDVNFASGKNGTVFTVRIPIHEELSSR